MTQDFNIGDIVTCSRRRQGVLYKVVEIETETWTQQQCIWNQCTQSQVGTTYQTGVKLNSIFDMTHAPRAKPRKMNFTANKWYCTKVEPQQLMDLIQRMDKFVSETWP
jgi:hypothetical protein